MKQNVTAVILLCASAIFSSCIVNRQAIYVSPFNGNSNIYHTIPLESDSLKSAFFINAAFASGRANFTSPSRNDTTVPGDDNISSFSFNIYRTHNLGIFEFYYGANFSIGNYSVNKFDSLFSDPTVNVQLINKYAGKKIFGGYGINGGMNAVIPFVDGGEFRVIGFELTLEHEYGNYLQFRKQIPYSQVTYVAPNNFYGTYGFFTEILFPKGHLGLKLEKGWIMGSQYNNLMVFDNSSQENLKYHYFNMTLSGFINKWTIYMQLNSATKATTFQFGTNYRIAKKKNSPQTNL
jgi:hypothetical protein